jgi:hypothetical protein
LGFFESKEKMVVDPDSRVAVAVGRADIFYSKQRGGAFRLYFILTINI